MGFKAKLWVPVFILLVAHLLLTQQIVRYSLNGFHRHPAWVNGKQLLAYPPMGATEAQSTRNFFHQNRLNLSAWHGFNEIFAKEKFIPGRITFDFSIAENGHINIIFGKNQSGFSGFRISRSPLLPNLFFTANHNGRFLNKKELGNLSIDHRWHHCELVFQNGHIQLNLDSAETYRVFNFTEGQQVAGFRSGFSPVFIDNVQMFDNQGRSVVVDDFGNHHTYWKPLFVLTLVFVVPCLGLIMGTLRHDFFALKKIFFLSYVVLLNTLLLFSGGYAFDYFFWSKQYPYETGFIPLDSQAAFKLNFLEKLREGIFNPFEEREALAKTIIAPQASIPPGAVRIVRSGNSVKPCEIVSDDKATIQSYISQKLNPSFMKVLFLGTSQTWGEGASRTLDQIPFQIEELLTSKNGGRRPTAVINASVRGSDSTDLLARFVDRLHMFKPDIVVVNLSSNDSYKNVDIFKRNLESLVEANHKSGTKTIFILEPVSMESPPDRLTQLGFFHHTMMEVAKDKNIPVIPLHQILSQSEIYNSGFLWWDYVHLTSYGQTLAAEVITASLLDLTR